VSSGERMSSRLNRRRPRARSVVARHLSGSPHTGQAGRYAARSGVKRSRQPGQEAWSPADLFRRGRAPLFGGGALTTGRACLAGRVHTPGRSDS